ncbi:MAG: hypothetical protein COA52_11495 [Hyphomicrobiales bacterium]|nr:MAG: hypothetical protein COA52_11495 [Hyphomicrobiales bacterium]
MKRKFLVTFILTQVTYTLCVTVVKIRVIFRLQGLHIAEQVGCGIFGASVFEQIYEELGD